MNQLARASIPCSESLLINVGRMNWGNSIMAVPYKGRLFENFEKMTRLRIMIVKMCLRGWLKTGFHS